MVKKKEKPPEKEEVQESKSIGDRIKENPEETIGLAGRILTAFGTALTDISDALSTKKDEDVKKLKSGKK